MENKRISVIPKNANPLFKQWLREWISDAEAKKKKISKTYEKALSSLLKYPLNLYTGHDCAILENFGPKICQMLNDRLEQHLSERKDLNQKLCFKDKISEIQQQENLKVSDIVRSVEAVGLTDLSVAESIVIDEDEEQDSPEMPAFDIPTSTQRDESFEVNEQENISPDDEFDEELISSAEDSEDSIDRIIRKYNPDSKPRKKKKELNIIKRPQKKATISSNEDQPASSLCSPISTMATKGVKLKKFNSFGGRQLTGPSFASSPISKFLDVETTAMKSPQINIEEDDEDEFDRLVGKYDFPSPISAPAPSLKRKSPIKANMPGPTQSKRAKVATQKSIPEADEEEALKFTSVDDINTNDYNVVLLLDQQETSARSKVPDEILQKLGKENVMNNVRKLHVGDFLWIAQHKTDKSKEFVLPYIVERKRLDDLSSSIKDGRFHEQKFRLKRCGIENVIYLIENYMKAGKVQCGLPFTTLLQAATNTQVHNKFQVKFTENYDHTILYLTVMTSFIGNIFKNKAPIKYKMLEFEKFNKSSIKQRRCTVREMFIKQLLSLKGLSVSIALEIAKNYPTPKSLYEAYIGLSTKDGEELLTKITIGELKRKVPKNVSKTLYHLYMTN